MQTEVLIIDDNPDNLDYYESLIETYFTDLKVYKKVSNYIEAQRELFQFGNGIALLDIQLTENKTVFDILNKLDSIPFKIIFISSYGSFALQGFKYSAIDYLVTPFQVEDFVLSVERALNQLITSNVSKELLYHFENGLNSSRPKVICIPTAQRIEIIKLNELIYLNSDGKYTTFYSKNDRVVISSLNLGEYEKMLSENFVRVHHSYIVNLDEVIYVDKVDGVSCIMSNSDMIPISKRKYKDLIEKMNPS